MLSRKSELRRLKNDLTLLDQDIASAEHSLQAMYQTLTGADSELEAMAAELDYANQRFADLKAELAAQDQTLERLRRERQAVSEQLITGDASLTEQEKELASVEQQATEMEAELAELVQALAASGDEIQSFAAALRQAEQERSEGQFDLVKQSERLEGLRTQIDRLTEELEQRITQHEEGDRRYFAADGKRSQILLQILNTRAARDERMLTAEQIQSVVVELQNQKMQLRVERGQVAEQVLAIRKERREIEDKHHANEMRIREFNNSLTTLNERLEEEYQLKLADVVESGVSAFALYLEERQAKGPERTRKKKDEAQHSAPADEDAADVTVSEPHATAPESEGEVPAHPHEETPDLTFEQVRPELEGRVNRLRKQLKLMGAVNTDSLRDLEMQETRYTQLAAQLQDLIEAKQTLEDIIRKINAESRRLFQETFETIRKNFQELFRQVFGGGEGDIVLEDPNDVLECGLDIEARPPGKELRSISLLSGGEKTMTAIALIMAIFKSKPSPFCILDEVDAALDEANVERFTAVVKAFQQTTQFIMITHHKRSMVVADLLYGVTMEESGVSKRMSVRFEDVSDDGNFKAPPQTSAA